MALKWVSSESLSYSPGNDGAPRKVEVMTLQDDAGNTLLTVGNDSNGNPYVTSAGSLASNATAVVLPSDSGTVSLIDHRIGDIHSTVVTLDEVAVTATNAGTGLSFGGTKILDFDAGQIYVLAAWSEGATLDGSDENNDSANVIDGSAGAQFAYGTAVATADLATTMVNIVPEMAADPMSGGAAAGRLAAAATFDGTSTAIDIYANINIDDADVGASPNDVIKVSDTLHIVWVYGGDD